MMIAVHMRDGRTVHILQRRAHLTQLVGRKPNALDGHRPIAALTRWNVDGGFEPSKLMYLAPGGISQVVAAAPPADAQSTTTADQVIDNTLTPEREVSRV